MAGPGFGFAGHHDATSKAMERFGDVAEAILLH
jgi:hypothetical protein